MDDPKERLEEFKKAAAEGSVVIGNNAFMSDKGKGSLKCWAYNEAFGVEYSIPGFGFGEFVFKVTEKKPNEIDPVNIVPTGRLSVHSECMGRDFVKAVMCKLIDEAEWDHDESDSMRNPL